ncbi:MAG: sugar phosphate isomerase/epimerase [Chloroflexi bacterium]|nr:sugar phosphate isomerase/epimerase [Chloroflexota bacterium]
MRPDAAAPAVLSTMWALQPRFEQALDAFVERARALGFSGIEINHSMDAAQVGVLLAQRALPVVAVHAPAPLERHPAHGWNRSLDPASEDEAERRLAVHYAGRSIELAGEAGASLVVLHLGAVGLAQLQPERTLRRLFARGSVSEEERGASVEAALRERARLAPPALDRARRSLAELVLLAEAHGVTLGLECRLYHHQIPLPSEAAELLAEHPPERVGYVHDVGHAEIQHRLGLVDRASWFDLLGERLVGVHLSDVNGLADHRAPGNGDVDFRWLAKRLSAGAVRTLEIDQDEPDDDIERGLELLGEAGVITRGAPRPADAS